MFPYMVDRGKATGGGDIPQFVWRVVEEDDVFWVESCGVHVSTLPVVHGRYFNKERSPFVCLGFMVGEGADRVAYISDASEIPRQTKEKLEGAKVLVLDALKRGPHPSHMGLSETVEFIEGMEKGAQRIYLTDFTHEIDHYQLEEELRETMEGDVRPAFDGLQVVLNKNGGLSEIDLLAERPWVSVKEQLKTEKENRAGRHNEREEVRPLDEVMKRQKGVKRKERAVADEQATREDEMSDDDGNSTSKSVIHKWMSESMKWCRIRV